MDCLFGDKAIHIQDNIFSEEELSSMLDMIKENDHLTQKFSQVNPTRIKAPANAKIYFGFFGTAAYFFTNNYKSYGDLTRNILLKNVNYTKVLEAISKFTGMKCSISSDLNPPGFHVFVNNSANKLNVSVKNWHRDIILGNPTLSFLVPISLPSANVGLDFYNKEQVIERLDYRLNCLYGWPSSITHTISDMELLGGESRITLQLHCYKAENKDELVVFW